MYIVRDGVDYFKLLKTEIWSILQRTESLFKYALAVSATVFAWLALNTFGLAEDGTMCLTIDSTMVHRAWYIPVGCTMHARRKFDEALKAQDVDGRK